MAEKIMSIETIVECLETFASSGEHYIAPNDNNRPVINEAVEAGLLMPDPVGRMIERPTTGPQSIVLFGNTIPIAADLVSIFVLTDKGRATLEEYRNG